MKTEADHFRELVPEDLRRKLVRLVLDGCTAAYERAAERNDPKGEFFLDAVSANRRLEVERSLSGLILPKGFTSEIIRTPSTHYTQLSSDQVVITSVTRAEEVEYVPPYKYRANLARANQLNIYSLLTGTPAETRPEHKLYALLVYGGRRRERVPSIARIVFPLPSGYVPRDSVDLLTDHSDIADLYKEKVTTVPEAQVALRDKAKTGENEG